ncbi:FUSC family protein [Desulfosediminicola sp.]|uniref:FUSC family protein n=1 Tax=Desulfosediminicola sp. TaxID=2886825 RepID=UPI003AF2A8E5
MNLSRKAKEAIKTALAAIIAIGIAVSLNWDNPKWAGFAVAFVSLATIGQSFTKAAMRMLGTLVAAVFSLFLLGLYPQERWLFMTVYSMYLGFCAYRMTQSRHKYFWMVSGFVCAIIVSSAGPDPAHAFHVAMTRTQETGLGILVYSVVTLLLWPVSSKSQFAQATDTVAATQQQMLAVLLKSLNGEDETEKIKTLRTQMLQAQAQFNQIMEGAIGDTYEVWEVRHQWRRYAAFSGKLTESMERLWESLDALQDIDLNRLVLNLDAVTGELNMRLSQIQRMLACQMSEQKPLPMTISPAADMVRALPPLQKAALISTHARLTELVQLTQSLYDIVSNIRGENQVVEIPEAMNTYNCVLPDIEGLKCSFFVMLNSWLVFLAVIYIDGLPGGFSVLSITASLTLGVVMLPQLPVKYLYLPVAIALPVGAVSYVVIMPHLSTFSGLAILIFAGVFGYCYVFSAPKQILGKSAGLALFLSMTSITNQQSYHFLAVTTISLSFCMPILMLTYSLHFPFSNRPEKVFLRLLCRYFRSCCVLTSEFSQNPSAQQSWFQRILYSYHLREIDTLPRKISSWIPFIDPGNLPGTTPQQIQAVQISVLALSYRMQELLEERQIPQTSTSGLEQQANEELYAWHQVILQEFKTLTAVPGTIREEQGKEIAEVVNRFEERLQYLFDNSDEIQYSEEDKIIFYRLLGACRGLSDALLRYISNAAAIDWQPWYEERF